MPGRMAYVHAAGGGSPAFLQRAKKEGYRLYVLSNASDEFYIYFPKSYDVNLFEGIVVSADLHIIKPDERIYRYLLERYGLNPGRRSLSTTGWRMWKARERWESRRKCSKIILNKL